MILKKFKLLMMKGLKHDRQVTKSNYRGNLGDFDRSIINTTIG